MAKSSPIRTASPAGTPFGPRRARAAAETARRALLAAIVGVLVATPLIPSEAAAALGTGVMLNMLWLLLWVGWSLLAWLAPANTLRWSKVDSALLVFLLLHSLAAIVMAGQGDARAAINMLWQWLSFGAAFFLVRQLVQTPSECRAICSVGLSLAVGLSVYAFYDYAYRMPQERARYERDPQAILKGLGIDSRPGSPERKLYENRLNSTEPCATFALTNSLAGFLTPWLTLALAVGVGSWKEGCEPWRQRAAVLASGVLIGFCLLLTKSRSATLAAAVGLLLVAWLRWRGQRRIGWRLPAAVVAAGAVLLGVAIVAGSFDWLVIAEAPKSILYRWQYWQATVRMIADYPWWGCGPGNFQNYYAAYKLPEASEMVADPHNFVLEIWATAGTPCLLALGVLWAAFVWRMGVSAGRTDSPVSSGEAGLPSEMVAPPSNAVTADAKSFSGAAVAWIYGGGILGLLLAYPCGEIVGFRPDGWVLVGLLPAAVMAFLWHPWVLAGRLPKASLLIPLVVLYVNLLAAGGISFAGVAQTGWLLAALALNQRERFAGSPSLGRAGLRAWAAASLILALLCLSVYHHTMYGPILRCQLWMAEATELANKQSWDKAEAAYVEAAAADPYAAEPWASLAALYQQSVSATGSQERLRQFELAVEELTRRRQHAQATWKQVGDWRLGLYRSRNDREQLARAIAAYQRCVQLYPNSSLARAQLAWALHLSGDDGRAAAEAIEALRLDELNPHVERKLALQQVFEPKSDGAGNETAEQCMLRLRN